MERAFRSIWMRRRNWICDGSSRGSFLKILTEDLVEKILRKRACFLNLTERFCLILAGNVIIGGAGDRGRSPALSYFHIMHRVLLRRWKRNGRERNHTGWYVLSVWNDGRITEEGRMHWRKSGNSAIRRAVLPRMTHRETNRKVGRLSGRRHRS